MKDTDIDYVADWVFFLAREVEDLAREGRYHFGDSLAEIALCYRDSVSPRIAYTQEAYDMDRILRALEDFSHLTERDWRRSAKARKQAMEMLRVAANQVIRKLLRKAIESNTK